MKNYITVSTVNFHAVWGNKDINRKRIIEYIGALARQGSDIIVFPEMALTGYDYDENINMQKTIAETSDGESIAEIAKETQKYEVYAVFGMPEKDVNGNIYNSAAVCGPQGIIGMYRKIHLAGEEAKWAIAGNHPFMFDTEWGPIGISICYDTYIFPEITRYYKAKKVRLLLNPTAVFKTTKAKAHMTTLLARSATDNIYIASANLYGMDHEHTFWGKSNIVGPAKTNGEAEILAGIGFDENESSAQTVETAEFDMSTLPYHTYSHLFDKNVKVGVPDWRPELYAKMCEELLKDSKWRRGEANG